MANKDKILKMLDSVSEAGSSLTAAAGFDAVKDVVTRVMRQKSGSEILYFSTIEEFASHLLTKKNMSCSVELKIQQEKIGGNMAIFSNSLGSLGVKVNCLGSLGYPKAEPLFEQMHENCNLYPMCQSGECNALEFHDGKVMLSYMDNLEQITWETMVDRIGKETLSGFFSESGLVALLNWSELPDASGLFTAVYENCFENKVTDKNKWLLFDLSDASRKERGALKEVLLLIQKFEKYRTIIFSMNENECRMIHRIFCQKEPGCREEMLREVGGILAVDYLILHTADCALGYRKGEVVKENGYYTSCPKLSTGGGDNFNAGLCFGITQGLELGDSLRLGNAVSGYYVRTGESPDVRQVYDFINTERTGDGRW